MASNLLAESSKFVFIFDLDGTLVDSAGQIARAVNQTRKAWRLSAIPDLEVFKNVGLPADSLFSDLSLGTSDLRKIVMEFREYLSLEITKSNKVYDDALKFVKMIKRNGFFVAVATSKPTDLAEIVINNSEYHGLIDQVVGIGTHKPKPDPGMLQEILSGNGFYSGVMFGDRPEDITAALRSGISAVGVAQSIFSPQDLLLVGAKRAFKNFSEVREGYENSGDDLIEYFR